MPTKILAVDDTPANLRLLEEILSPLGEIVVSASSGEQALKEVLKSEFAVILLDVKMSGIDGFETAALIRGKPRTKNTPIIFLTAYDDSVAEVQRAYDLGAFDFLTKPFDPTILRYKVAAFVRMYQQAEQLRLLASELKAKRDALLEAEETTRLRDVFVGVLGHDLRNPLSAISLTAAALHEAPDLPAHHKKSAERIARSVTRMDRLIHDVLDFTRGQLTDGIPVVPEPANLELICRRIIDELRAGHPERELTLAVSVNSDGHWDPERLGQVVSNLAANAIQHCHRDPVTVDIDGSEHAVRLTVGNSGHIDSRILSRLFEPFRRGDNSSAGLGLGLYIVREIVRAHHGTVSVHSDADTDRTAFVVELPRAV